MLHQIQFETERLLIRSAQLADARSIYEIQRDPDVHRYIPVQIYSFDEVQTLMGMAIEMMRQTDKDTIRVLFVSVIEKKSNQLIGFCGLEPLSWDSSIMQIYAQITKEMWGKGLATEGGRAVMQFAFETLGLETLVAVADPLAISNKVVEKLGMTLKKQCTGLPEEFKTYEGYNYYECDLKSIASQKLFASSS